MCDKHGSKSWVVVPPAATQHGQAINAIQDPSWTSKPQYDQPADSLAPTTAGMEANKDVYKKDNQRRTRTICPSQ